MATTYADNYSTTAFKSFGDNIGVFDVTHEITTAELGTADKIIFGKVPAGTTYLDGYVACDDLDGGTSLVFAIGDDDDNDGLLTSNNIGQTGGVATFDGSYIINQSATDAEKLIAITVGLGAGTPQAGTVRIVINYTTL